MNFAISKTGRVDFYGIVSKITAPGPKPGADNLKKFLKNFLYDLNVCLAVVLHNLCNGRAGYTCIVQTVEKLVRILLGH